MIVQRLFSHTWENLKTKEQRTAKANELKEKRAEINTRRNQIKKNYESDLKNAALGNKNKNGEYVNLKKSEGIYKNSMEDLNKYTDSITDQKHRTPEKPKPAPKQKPRPQKQRSGIEKTVKYAELKGKKLLRDPRAKKAGYLGAGALTGTLAISGIDKLVKNRKEKNKENEMRSQIVNGKKEK